MILGDIIKVEDANTYVVKIPPDSRKERIGRFVKIKKGSEIMVGVIKGITHSIREDLIPYIDPEMQPKYAPFNEDFRNSCYIIHGLGVMRDGIVKYGIDTAPDIRDAVEILSSDEIRDFHTINGKPSIAYFHTNRDLDKEVLLSIAEQVEACCPECSAMLGLVRKHIVREK